MRWMMLGSLLLSVISFSLRAETIHLAVHTEKVLREDADQFIGINLNYIRDADSNRPGAKPLVETLKEMNVHWLRYPGGEKSDFCRWASPPYDRPQPQSLKSYAKNPGDRLDFDQYMEVVRKLGAEPYIVVGYDTFQRTGVTKEEWIQSAVGWVRYANQVKKYGIRYWEIGNENWHNNTAGPGDMAEIVVEFSRAMKEADPTILVGASGNNPGWWEYFLPKAGPALDFVSQSLYNCEGWGGYSYFPEHLDSNTIAPATQTLESLNRYLKPEDRSRIKLIIAETNSKDFSKKPWPGRNNLGHALVLFDTLGRLMKEQNIPGAMVWTTRWMKDEEASQSQWYALGPQNEILPAGMSLEIWGRFLQKQMVEVTGVRSPLRAYASQSANQKKLTLWILNAGISNPIPVQISLSSPTKFSEVKSHLFTGANPEDDQPCLQESTPPVLSDGSMGPLVCPPFSITVLTLE